MKFSFVTVYTMRSIALLTKKYTFEIPYPIQQQVLLFTHIKSFPKSEHYSPSFVHNPNHNAIVLNKSNVAS